MTQSTPPTSSGGFGAGFGESPSLPAATGAPTGLTEAQAPAAPQYSRTGEQPQYAGQPVAPATPPTAPLAIWGLVTSFFFSAVGLVLSLVALSQIKKSEGRLGGRGLAIAGVVVGALGILGGILFLVTVASAFAMAGGTTTVTYGAALLG